MAAKPRVESISPFLVYKRVVVGVACLVIAFILHSQNKTNDNTVELVFGAVGVALFIWGWNAVANPRLALKYAHNPARTVRELIEEWTPTPARLESEYEQSLHKFLKSKLSFVKVTRQYGTARVKCDIATGNHVMIEMKAGFKSTQKLQRLIGQVDLFNKEWGKPIIILLLGDSEEDLLHDLNRSVQNYPSVTVVVKNVGATVESEDIKAKAHNA